MLKKIVLWLLALAILFSGGIITYIYYNQDVLKNQLVVEINKRLKVPVDVDNLAISPLSSFPNATVVFHNITIADPYKENQYFIVADEVGFSFNIWDLLQGDMVLEEIYVRDGDINIRQYTAEKWSYQIYKEPEKKSDGGEFTFDIKKARVHNLKTTYSSSINNTEWKGTIADAAAAIRLQGPVTWINFTSDIASSFLKINEFQTLQNQEVIAEAEMIIDKHWSLRSSLLSIGDSFFKLAIKKDEEYITADFDADNANVQTLLSITPEQFKKRLANYTSTGKISLESNLIYTIASGKNQLKGNLSFNGVDIIQQDPKINLTGLNLSGRVSIPDFDNLTTASMFLDDIVGRMNNKPLEAALQLTNFSEPFIRASYSGEMPLAFLKDLGGLELNNPSGNLIINLSVEGTIASFSESLKTVKTSGEVTADKLTFFLPDRAYKIEIPAGTAIFTNEHLAINDLRLLMGQSEFKVNGQLRNFWNLNSETNPWSATADVQAKALMLDELLSIKDPNPKSESYAFNIPGNINLELNATIDEFRVRQFNAERISGKIIVKNKVITADKLSLKSMGGTVKLKGEWRDLGNKGSDINASFLLAGINADSLFYSFENFNQDFITERNLSGKIYAEAETSLRLDSNLRFLPNSLNATLKTRIIDGELRDFKPLYSLEKYFNDADLSAVKFAELENQIHIQNQTINLPMMAIGTNIIKFKIGGTHTFDQYIDYDVVAPLNRKKRVDKDEQFGVVEEDQHGQSLIFLSIIGTTKDFEVSLDKEALKSEIASDVKREVKDLQDAFKNNGKTTVNEVELEQDDYFEWEED